MGDQSSTAVADRLGGATVRAWAATARTTLAARRDELDALNVFPVADSDTGTNLWLTVASAATALDAVPADAPDTTVAAAFARGALVGARGNSGVIVGQYLGALVRTWAGPASHGSGGGPGAGAAGREGLVDALHDAADAAYAAVAEPIEGTVLTVGRVVARAARATGASGGLDVLEPAIEEGYLALRRTSAQLPALAAAGVLDAGAWGLLLVLDALAASLGSEAAATRSRADLARPTREERIDGAVAQPSAASATGHCHGGGEFEVMYLVTPAAAAGADVDLAPALRTGLSAVGESVAVMGGEGLWQVHVHTDAPQEAIAVAAASGGAGTEVRVRHVPSHEAMHGRRPGAGLVAATASPGLVAELARAGAVVVLAVDGRHAAAEVVRAAQDTGAPDVLVLAAVPVDPALAGEGRTVLAGLSEVQLVSGAATWASLRPAEGADAALLLEVERVVRSVRTAAVDPPPGDAEDVGGERHAELVTAAVTELLASGGTLLTAVSHDDTAAGALEVVSARLQASHPALEVVTLTGGRPGRTIHVGVE
ncbi:MAG: hypothetical protein JWP95_415 [Actinotalea sp.]|nr:hypothetical protein [Actinotalea sp.]